MAPATTGGVTTATVRKAGLGIAFMPEESDLWFLCPEGLASGRKLGLRLGDLNALMRSSVPFQNVDAGGSDSGRLVAAQLAPSNFQLDNIGRLVTAQLAPSNNQLGPVKKVCWLHTDVTILRLLCTLANKLFNARICFGEWPSKNKKAVVHLGNGGRSREQER
jgi:hypothetical protein